MTTRQTPDAVREAVALTITDAGYYLRKYRPHCLEALEKALTALDSRAGDAGEGLRNALKPLAFEGVTIPRGLDRDLFWITDAVTGRSITVGEVLDARAALSATPAPAVDAVPAGEVERARQIAADTIGVLGSLRDDYLAGIFDSGDHVRIALASLSHGEGRK